MLPFFGFCAGAWWLDDWPAALSRQGFVIYSLGILSFLGGSLWGRVQASDNPDVIRLLISNGIVQHRGIVGCSIDAGSENITRCATIAVIGCNRNICRTHALLCDRQCRA